MKKIEAFIRHFKLDDVKQALISAGASGMTVSEIRGCGREHRPAEVYRGMEYAVDFLPRTKVEVIVADGDCERIQLALAQAARTGQVGDGRILISRIEDVCRVRTGEEGEEAI